MRKGNPYLQIRLEPHVLELLQERLPSASPAAAEAWPITCAPSSTTTSAWASPPASPLRCHLKAKRQDPS